MGISFPRSLASLRADGHRRSLAGLGLAAALVAAWGAWLGFGRIGLYESSATARLEVQQASHPVQAPVAGRVTRSRLVLERSVSEGELLVELESTAEQYQLKEEQTRKEGLLQQLAAVRNEIGAETRALKLEIETGRAEIVEAQAKRRQREVTARFTEDRAQRLRPLGAGGQLPEIDVLKATTEAETEQAELEALSAGLKRLAKDQRARAGDRRAVIEKLRGEVTQLSGLLATAEVTIKRLEHEIERRRIRAAVSGQLGEITPLVEGAYVREGELLASIVPHGTPRAVAHFAASAALGRIRTGQSAQVRLEGFPWTQYGSIPARVTRVGSESRQSQVRVELDLRPVPGSPLPVQHGLPAEVVIQVERVTPLELVLRAAGSLLSRPGRAAPPPAGAAAAR